ncbi:FAD synthase-like, partial [Asbolus verrucosus]
QISIIGDEVDEICKEVKTFSESYDYVITTGGIGPTHDDVTFEGVAKAFNVPLAINPHLRTICEHFYNTTDANHPGMKLARVPQCANLNFSDQGNYPNVQVENVYLFPGIPQLFVRSFDSLSAKLFKSDGSSFYTKCIYVNVTEDKIADQLSRLVAAFPDVQVGSYPKLYDKTYKVKITIESTNEESSQHAFNWLLEKLPKEVVVDVH